MNERLLTLRVRWTQPVPLEQDGNRTEFGMQKGRSELIPGVLQADGSTVFETEVAPYRDKQGRQRFRGACVQGPPEEPFLYLSCRFAGSAGWIGRGKALLEPLTDDFLATVPEGMALETTMSRLGHRDAGQMTRWRVVD